MTPYNNLKPLVSVIIPMYNSEEFVAETLESVCASIYPNIEIIVCDDGSQDRGVEIVEQWAARDKRIKLLRQDNAGPSRARNHAIEHAHGKYILPVDADDKISPTYIDSAVETIEADAEVMVVTCRCLFFGNREGEWYLPDFSTKRLATENRIHAASLYRRSDWRRIGGYNENIIAREDWAFWIAMLKDGGKVIKLPEVGLFYRVRTASKRFQDRKLKALTVEKLNALFPDFFERELGGKLYVQRSHSKIINALRSLFVPKNYAIDEHYNHYKYYVRALPRIAQHKQSKEPFSDRFGGDNIEVVSFPLKWGNYKNSAARKAYLEAKSRGEKVIGYCSESRGWLFHRSYMVRKKQ